MMALVQEAASEIEQRLLEQSTERERALPRAFLAACRRADRATIYRKINAYGIVIEVPADRR